MEVLIVNPHSVWTQRLKARLRTTASRVTVVEDWNRAESSLDEAWPDVLIVENRILELDSARILAAFRRGEWFPVIVATDFEHLSSDAEHISLHGEDSLRRLETVLTRLQGAFGTAAQRSIRVGKLTIDPVRKEVVFQARRVRLTPNEFRLLLYLALNAGRVVEQRELMREVWGYAGSEAEARELIKAYVRLIRRKLGWTDQSTNYLQSVRGFGYMLSVPARDKKQTSQGPIAPPQ